MTEQSLIGSVPLPAPRGWGRQRSGGLALLAALGIGLSWLGNRLGYSWLGIWPDLASLLAVAFVVLLLGWDALSRGRLSTRRLVAAALITELVLALLAAPVAFFGFALAEHGYAEAEFAAAAVAPDGWIAEAYYVPKLDAAFHLEVRLRHRLFPLLEREHVLDGGIMPSPTATLTWEGKNLLLFRDGEELKRLRVTLLTVERLTR